MTSKPPADAVGSDLGASQGIVTLVGEAEVRALRLDRPWLTQEALDEARRTVGTWPCLGPVQWTAVADALGLRLRDNRQPLS